MLWPWTEYVNHIDIEQKPDILPLSQSYIIYDDEIHWELLPYNLHSVQISHRSDIFAVLSCRGMKLYLFPMPNISSNDKLSVKFDVSPLTCYPFDIRISLQTLCKCRTINLKPCNAIISEIWMSCYVFHGRFDPFIMAETLINNVTSWQEQWYLQNLRTQLISKSDRPWSSTHHTIIH